MTKFRAVFHSDGRFSYWAVVIAMRAGFPESENIITAGDTEITQR